MNGDVSYRLAVGEDVPRAAAIIKWALDDLAARQGQPLASPEGDPMVPALLHVLDVSPDRFWVAEAGGGLVGFAAGLLRGDVCWLAGLFVAPGCQGRGIGHELLRRAMAERPGLELLPVVGSSAANVVSNGLYARHSMYPLHPTLTMTGVVPESMRTTAAGVLSREPLTTGDLEELCELDLAVTGIDRTGDHVWLLEGVARPGWVYRSGGALAGYAYLGGDGTVSADQVGPAAARSEEHVAEILASALVQRGVGRMAVLDVPGPNLAAQRLLWNAGFQMDHAAGLIGAAHPFGQLERYVFAGNVLM